MIRSKQAIKFLHYFSIVLVTAYFFIIPYNLYKYDRQWDFRTYYQAAAVHQDGGNPYNYDELANGASENIIVPYIYPPLATFLWKPFLIFDYSTSYYINYVLKLIALFYLILLWRKYFVCSKLYRALLLVLCVYAFKEALQVDIYSGNISIFEQALVWTGLLFFIKKKPVYFSVFILAASFIKFTSILLLLLLLLDNNRKSWLCLITFSLSLVVVHALSFIITPGLARGFIAGVFALNETGGTNQASYLIFSKFSDWLNNLTGLSIPYLCEILYIVFIFLLFATFYYFTRKYDFKADRFGLVVGGLFVYALLLPRLKDYSLIILILPALYIIENFIGRIIVKILAVTFICIYFFKHQGFFVVLVLYIFYLIGIYRKSIVGRSDSTSS